MTNEGRRKSDIEEQSCKWEGTSKKGRTIIQYGSKSKYEEREKKRKRKEQNKSRPERKIWKGNRIGIKGRRNTGSKK